MRCMSYWVQQMRWSRLCCWMYNMKSTYSKINGANQFAPTLHQLPKRLQTRYIYTVVGIPAVYHLAKVSTENECAWLVCCLTAWKIKWVLCWLGEPCLHWTMMSWGSWSRQTEWSTYHGWWWSWRKQRDASCGLHEGNFRISQVGEKHY